MTKNIHAAEAVSTFSGEMKNKLDFNAVKLL